MGHGRENHPYVLSETLVADFDKLAERLLIPGHEYDRRAVVVLSQVSRRGPPTFRLEQVSEDRIKTHRDFHDGPRPRLEPVVGDPNFERHE